MRTDIHDLALGKWRSLLPELGIHEQFLTDKHGPCPICGGKDRFRWDNKDGRGSYICSKCGPGSGVDLVIGVNRVDFRVAKQMIEAKIGTAKIEPIKPRRGFDSSRFVDRWKGALKLSGDDQASVYLRSRGIEVCEYPSVLRYMPRQAYYHDDKSVTYHPALAALFVGPDLKEATVHFTHLADDGLGKANVREAKKLAPGKIPQGGAVRLGSSAETMGIGSGLETSLAASILFGIPVWASLNDGNLIKWTPPERARHIVIFGDHDENYCGQAAAYTLAHKLRCKGYEVDIEIPARCGDDWCDVLGRRGSRKEIT